MTETTAHEPRTGRRWLKLLNPNDFGLPEWAVTLRPLSHLAPGCVTYHTGSVPLPEPLERVHVLGSKEEFFRILAEGDFEPQSWVIGRPDFVGDHTTIGAPPFKVVTLDGRRQLARSRGGVSIGRGVVILANCAIQAGIFGEYTEIGDEVMIDAGVSVAHGCIVGRGSVLTAGSVLGGWVEIGDRVRVGLNATILPHVKVGDGAEVGAGARVDRDVPPGHLVFPPQSKQCKWRKG